MTYLDTFAQQHRAYAVLTYTDHIKDEYIHYYDDYATAYKWWLRQVMRRETAAVHTAAAVLVRLEDNKIKIGRAHV